MKIRLVGPRRRRVLLDDDVATLLRDVTLSVNADGYVVCFPFGYKQTIYLHHFILGQQNGKCIDHVNGNKLDNRRRNLRHVSYMVNAANARKLSRRNTSGLRGVYYYPQDSKLNPWIAHIRANGKRMLIGYFPTKQAAHAARRAEELRYFGEYCPRAKPQRKSA